MENDTVEAPEEGSISFVSTSQLGGGKCPFRGYPNRFPLDERCPEEVECLWTAGAKMIVREGGFEDMRTPCAIVRNDSQCRSCLDDMVREKEHGMDTRSNPSYQGPGVMKGRRKRGGGRSKTRKEQIAGLTEQLKEDRR